MSLIDEWAIKFQRRLLKNNNFTIIANDCWGGELYRNFDLAYLTPFVGTMVLTPCYIKLLKNFKFYMDCELQFIPQSKYEERNIERRERNDFYPIATLNNDLEIHFFHYKNEREASAVWNKLKEGINWDDLYIKIDGSKDACTPEFLREFETLPYKNKICLGKEKFKDISCSVAVDHWVMDGAKNYRQSLENVNVIDWLNGGDFLQNRVFFTKFLFY